MSGAIVESALGGSLMVIKGDDYQRFDAFERLIQVTVKFKDK